MTGAGKQDKTKKSLVADIAIATHVENEREKKGAMAVVFYDLGRFAMATGVEYSGRATPFTVLWDILSEANRAETIESYREQMEKARAHLVRVVAWK